MLAAVRSNAARPARSGRRQIQTRAASASPTSPSERSSPCGTKADSPMARCCIQAKSSGAPPASSRRMWPTTGDAAGFM